MDGPRAAPRVSALAFIELQRSLREVIELLLEDGEPHLEAEFVGTHTVLVA